MLPVTEAWRRVCGALNVGPVNGHDYLFFLPFCSMTVVYNYTVTALQIRAARCEENMITLQ